MKTPITSIKRLALALCLATPVVSWAATSVYSTYNNDTDTPSAGGAYTGAQTVQLNADWMFNVDGEDIAATASAVKLDSIMVYWPGSTHGNADIGHNKGGEQPDAYLVLTTPQGIVVGVSGVNDKKWAAWNNSTYTFDGGVVVSPNAQYEFRWVTDTTGIVVGEPFPSASQKYARVLGAWHGSGHTANSTVHIGFATDTGALLNYSVWSRFTVSEVTATTLTTGAEPVALSSGTDPVVVTGAVEGGIVNVASEATVPSLTVIGEATTLKLADSLTADYVYLPAAVTIDASAVSGLEPTGEDTSKTTPLLSCGLSYKTAPTVIFPNAAATIYEASVTDSGISVTATKGVDCVETITENTSWSTIKPTGWIDLISGDKPAIEITYEGEDPVTLTFDETVTAGMLKLTGNIVVEASEAATFGTVTAGAGSVVEMANVTVSTQAGAGTYRYRSNYPSAVPNGITYAYVGGATDAETVVISGDSYFNNEGTLKTSGFISFANFWTGRDNAKLDVLSGKTTINSSYQKCLRSIIIRDGAEMVNVRTSDALSYGSSLTVDVYGTLSMGQTRWTVGDNNAIKIHGGTITGVGEDNNGALDFIGTGSLTADADSTISANVKFRNALSSVTVNDGVTLTISGATKPGYNSGGITKKGNGTLKFTSDPYVPGGIVVEAGTLAFDTESDVDPVVTYTAAVLESANMDYVSASNWKGRVVVSAVEAGDTATQVALNKTGNAHSYLTLNGISGNAWCAGSTYTVQPAITLAGDVNFQNGSSSKTVTFRKIAAGTGNLSLKAWSGGNGVGYGFTTLDADNYTGTIQLEGVSAEKKVTFNVGDILKVGATVGDIVLPLTANEFVTVNLENATVNGESVMLEVREGGLYVKYPNVAQIGDTKYETLAAALDDVEAGQTITLLQDIALAEAVTVDESITIDGAYTISGSGMMLNLAAGKTLTLTGGLTVSCQIGFLGALDTKVVAETGVTIGVWRPNGFTGAPNEAQPNTPSDGWTTYTVSAYTTVAITAGNSSVKDGDDEDVVGGYRTAGTTIEFYVTPNSGYTLVSVTVNGTPISADEFGKYSVVVGEESLQIVVNTEEASSDTYEITGETELVNGAMTIPAGTTTITLGTYDVTAGFDIDDTTATLIAPEVVEGEDKAVVVGEETVTLNVALVPGLYYGVGASEDLTIAKPTMTQYTGSNAAAILTVTKPSDAKGFFKVFVDIKQ